MNDISLSSGIRSNLFSLQQTTSLMARSQERLATGKEVNSAIDDPSRFFASQQHKARANDLISLKSDMGEAIQAIKAADKGISAITSLLSQMKGVATSARSADVATRAVLSTQFSDLAEQVEQLALDSGYKGTNFLDNSTLTVAFNESGDSSIDVVGADIAGGGDFVPVQAIVADGDIDLAITAVNTAVSAFRALSTQLSTNLSVITARQEFTQQMSDVLETGADNLTNADTNREGANLLALQTRQQLGTISLSMSSQSAQAVLRLF